MTMTSETVAMEAELKVGHSERLEDMTSARTNTSSMSPTRSEVEVDGEGKARCPDCGEFTVETMVSFFSPATSSGRGLVVKGVRRSGTKPKTGQRSQIQGHH